MNTFAGLLTSFQKQRKLVIEQAKKAVMGRNKMGVQDVYRLEEKSIVTQDGATVHSVELWKRIDVEHTKFSADVQVEQLKEESLKKLTKPPTPPMPSEPKEPEREESLKDLMS